MDIRIFLGYDEGHPIGSLVCEQSISDRSSKPISVTHLRLASLRDIFTRPKNSEQLTDFSYSRFIVPSLCEYKGWALFMDGQDMMLRDDIAKLWALKDERYAVMVVKHPDFEGLHTFGETTITPCHRFNWSSVMLFNNARCKALTPMYVNTANYEDLHQFKWSEEAEIGELPNTWNHLVGRYKPREDAALVHWTLGAPYQGGDFAISEHTK